uniref:protein-serine/threonine phosphatase n=1 Tax=Plectus sambesii TaxID=2011161 RepID=A0A914W7Q0_9BILA
MMTWVVSGEIQQHLQAMLHLLRPQDTLRMAVRLESVLGLHTRYMAIVSTLGREDDREATVLGVDYVARDQTTIGLVLPVWASTSIELDGDGGILVESAGSQHVFKPVSVQAMWSVFQCLHKELSVARAHPYFPGGWTHAWTQYYESQITSPEAFRSEWHYTFADDTELKADSVERFREKPAERAAGERMVRLALKDIMQSVDLDDVTSKDIRQKLEERLEVNLTDYKEYIDKEMLVILGQMDKPSQIFPYLYLGTEWNASNWDELKQNNVGFILNVTKEVDNFFPGQFNYMKIRVSDEASTELLKHWNRTFEFINKAKGMKCAVLVHCKKGISRSSSTVIAYAMKAYNMSLEQALQYVKEKRNCITPNKGFIEQLRTFDGILDASRYRHSAIFNHLHLPTTLTVDSTANTQPKSVDGDLVPWQGLDEQDAADLPIVAVETITIIGERADSAPPDSVCDDVIVSQKFDEMPPPSGLLVASENILKSCPGSTVDGDGETGELFSTDALDDVSQANGTCPANAKSTSDDASPLALPLIDPWTKLAVGCGHDDDIPGELCAQSFLAPVTCVELAADDLPPVSCRPPVRRQLQSVEQRIRAHQRHNQNEAPTLRDMQNILIRTNNNKHQRNSASSIAPADGSTSGASSLLESSSDSSSLESHSGDEGAAASFRLPPRRNSKSSSGDSAVAELGSSPKSAGPQPSSSFEHEPNLQTPSLHLPRPRSMTCLPTAHFADILPAAGKVKYCKETYERHSVIAPPTHAGVGSVDSRIHRVGSASSAPVAPLKKSSRKFFEKFFTRQRSDEKADASSADGVNGSTPQPKRWGDVRRRAAGTERAKSQSSPTDPGTLFQSDPSVCSGGSLRSSAQSGKVQNQREKLERLSRDKGVSGVGEPSVSVRRIASNVETRRLAQHLPPRSAAVVAASEENIVRSLVGVFEGGSSASLAASPSATPPGVKESCSSSTKDAHPGSGQSSADSAGRARVLFGIAPSSCDGSPALSRSGSMKLATDWPGGHVRSSRSLTVGDVGGGNVSI